MTLFFLLRWKARATHNIPEKKALKTNNQITIKKTWTAHTWAECEENKTIHEPCRSIKMFKCKPPEQKNEIAHRKVRWADTMPKKWISKHVRRALKKKANENKKNDTEENWKEKSVNLAPVWKIVMQLARASRVPQPEEIDIEPLLLKWERPKILFRKIAKHQKIRRKFFFLVYSAQPGP